MSAALCPKGGQNSSVRREAGQKLITVLHRPTQLSSNIVHSEYLQAFRVGQIGM